MSLESQTEPQVGQKARAQTVVTPQEERLSLMDLWRVLMKRRMIILVTTIIFFAVAALYSFRTKPVYESVSRVEINPNKSTNVGLQSLIQEGQSGQESSALATELLILQSDSVMLQTAQSLGLDKAIKGANTKIASASVSAPQGQMTARDRRGLIGLIRGGLRVQIVNGTQIVDIRYRSTDPQLVAKVVNNLVDTYIDQDLRSRFDRTMHVSTWLQKQLEDLKKEASDAQRRLADYERAHNIVGSDETSNLTMANLNQISGQFVSSEADRIMKEARMREFESKDSDIAALMGDDPELGSLRAHLTDLRTQRADLGSKYGSHHPRMQELDAQIQKVQASIDTELSLSRRQVVDEYAGALRLQQSMRNRLNAQKEEAYRLNEDVAQYSILRHEAELLRDLYDTLQMRLKEASVTAGLSATNITVIDRAEAPFAPVGPNIKFDLLLGLLGGLIVGTILAFMMESIDDSLQTSEEVESISMLPSLATVPHILSEAEKRKRAGKQVAPLPGYAQQLTVLRDAKSNAAEAFRSLRSALLLSSVDKPPQVILLTSAFPGEGKTTTAVNLAIVLAQRGERVLLVDADLRRGTLDKVLGLADRDFGLSTVLSHPGVTRQLPVPLPEVPTLHVLPTGPRPPNPAEMLSSHRMMEQLQQWRKEFDRVVFDTAPVLAVSDTQAMSTLADSVVLVARAGVTRKRALVRARDILMRINAPIAGVVVNDVDMRLENFYTSRYGMYGYNYGYKYRYGRPYSDNAYGYEDEEKEKEKVE